MFWLMAAFLAAALITWLAPAERWPAGAMVITLTLLFGTLWYIANLLERIAVRIGAIDRPPRDQNPVELLRSRPQLADRKKYQPKR